MTKTTRNLSDIAGPRDEAEGMAQDPFQALAPTPAMPMAAPTGYQPPQYAGVQQAQTVQAAPPPVNGPMAAPIPGVTTVAVPQAKKQSNSVPRSLSLMLNPEYISTAEWKIVQNTSEVLKNNPGSQGKFFHTISKTLHESVDLIFVGFKVSRKFFNDKDRSSAMLCFSDDAITNSGGQIFSPFSQMCKTCPHEKSKDGQQPPCTFMFDYTVVSPGAQGIPLPSFFSVSKTSISVARQFNSQLLGMCASEENPREPYEFVFRLSSTVMQMPKGISYVPVFSYLRETTPEERGACALIADQFVLHNSRNAA